MSANTSRPPTSSGNTAPSPSSATSVDRAAPSTRSHPSAHRHSHSHSYSTPSTTNPGQLPYPHSPYIGTGSTLSNTAIAVEHTPGPGQCFCSTCHLKTRVFPRRQDGKIVLPSPWLVSQTTRPGRPEDVDRQRLEQQQQGPTTYRRRAMTAVSTGGSAAGSRITSANGATYLHGDASRAVQELEDDPDKTTVVSRHARIGSSRSRTASTPKPYDVAVPPKRSESMTETSIRFGRQSSRSVSQVGSTHVVSGSAQGYYPTGHLSGSRDSLPSTPSSATGDTTASHHGLRGPTSRETNYTSSTNPRLATSTVMRYNSWSEHPGESSSGPSARPNSSGIATPSSSPDLANGNRIRFQSPVVPDTAVSNPLRPREVSIVQVKWESDRKRRQGYFSQDDGPEKSPFRHYNKSECDFDR